VDKSFAGEIADTTNPCVAFFLRPPPASQLISEQTFLTGDAVHRRTKKKAVPRCQLRHIASSRCAEPTTKEGV
jgi:hypothetical protein